MPTAVRAKKNPKPIAQLRDDASLEGNPTSAGMLSHFAGLESKLCDSVNMLIPFKV